MKEDDSKKETNNRPISKRKGHAQFQLSVPWADQNNNVSNYSNIGAVFETSNNMYAPVDESDLNDFVQTRSRLHQHYITETEKTKRLGLLLSFVLILAAVLIMVFAPSGRETLSYWIGGALIVFAGGTAGYKRIRGKTPIGSIQADQDHDQIPRESQRKR